MVTRPKISWSELRGAAVGLWGLGVEGGANLRRLRAMGSDPVLVDDDPPGPEVEGLPILSTARGGLEQLQRCEVVVKTPGLSRNRPDVVELTASGVAVVGGLGLWMEEADRGRVACVTGTKGKSTTSVVAGHLARGLGQRCLVGGNIGRLPWDPELDGEYDLWVVETSSFQATDLASTPSVVAVTALSPDHLDWHGDAETYFSDKLSACNQPGAAVTVANADSDLLAARAGDLGPRVRWVAADDSALGGGWVERLGLLGEHNRRNALIARACLQELGAEGIDDDERLADAAGGFTGLESRLRCVGVLDGVVFIDDGLATNVLPTLAALDAVGDRRVALLVGGHDRGIDYQPLADALVARRAPTFMLTLPVAGARIGAAVKKAKEAYDATAGDRLSVADCEDLATATRRGFEWARPDGIVLLSPAAPSFGQFHDYRERSAAFAAALRALGGTDHHAGSST